MRLAILIKNRIFLVGFLGVLIVTLCILFYASQSKDQSILSNEQTIETPNDTAINETAPIESAEQSEESAQIEPQQSTQENNTKVSPGNSASNSSHTSINISTDNGNSSSTINVSLEISDDGCRVDANGPTGTQLTIDAKNDKKGGQQMYTLDGTPISVPSGGVLAGMTVEARIIDPSGDIKASSSSTIGPIGCS